MAESDRVNGSAAAGVPNMAAAASVLDPPGADTAPRGMDPADRPGASGHRFGPDLACSECGMHWDAHQREPVPCAKDAPGDLFLRRPVLEG